MSLVTYELQDHIATIKLNRPEARNAINGALRQDLNAAWDRFRDEEDAWVGILTANGSVFCTGAASKTARGRSAPLAARSGRSRRSTPSRAGWNCSSRPSPPLTVPVSVTG